MSGVRVDHMTDYKPVKEHPDCGEVLLDSRCGIVALDRLYISGYMDRLHAGELGQAPQLTPGRKMLHRIQVGFARVVVSQVCREKFKKTFLGFRVLHKERRGMVAESDQGS